VSYSHGHMGSKTFHVSGSSARELGAALDKARGNAAAAASKAKTNVKRAVGRSESCHACHVINHMLNPCFLT